MPLTQFAFKGRRDGCICFTAAGVRERRVTESPWLLRLINASFTRHHNGRHGVLETDYLIIGTGALGMGFGDQLLTDDPGASLLFVDKHPLPGGHWNDAYSFVRLHQPSAFYGVGSRDLGSNRLDESGINAGFYELATGPEVKSYFTRLMDERFLPSGRVRYFPLSEYNGDGSFTSLATGETQGVKVRRRIVDATFFNTSVPSTRPPHYSIADGVRVIPPNGLPDQVAAHSHYTVVGGGKTGMDVCVWLLQNGVAANAIRWIVPRDSWLINRETTQPGDRFYSQLLGAKAVQLEACAEATSIEQLFELLERSRQLLRLDSNVTPQMYHGATIAPAEIALLASISDIVRLGRVQAIEPTEILLEQGSIAASADELYIDCTASAIARRPTRPIFDGDTITVQMIRAGLFSLSAAIIAHVEVNYTSDDEKNRLCQPMQAPDAATDWLLLLKAENAALARWGADKSLRDWMAGHRLTGANLRSDAVDQDPAIAAIRDRIRTASARAAANLEHLITLIG